MVDAGINSIKSLNKALDILDYFVQKRTSIGVSDISSSLGLNKSTVHGVLNTLLQRGIVEQDPATSKYRLGLFLLQFASVVLDSIEVRLVAKPYLEELVNRHGETVHLVVLRQGEVVYIDKQESPHAMRISTEIGKRLPAHCTGVGKVLLASLSEKELEFILTERSLEKYTLNTITDPQTLKRQLQEIKNKGYATDNEEIEEGLRCVAAPIRDYLGQVVAAVSIAGPSMRMSLEKMESIAESVKEIAGHISTALGYSGK